MKNETVVNLKEAGLFAPRHLSTRHAILCLGCTFFKSPHLGSPRAQYVRLAMPLT